MDSHSFTRSHVARSSNSALLSAAVESFDSAPHDEPPTLARTKSLGVEVEEPLGRRNRPNGDPRGDGISIGRLEGSVGDLSRGGNMIGGGNTIGDSVLFPGRIPKLPSATLKAIIRSIIILELRK